jgi:hypothetical protein
LFLVAFARKPWLSGWVPEQRQTSFAEPVQQAFNDKDCSEGVMKKLY